MQSTFQDQTRITDVLTTQKNATSGYNTFANEASDPVVKNTLMGILEEEHDIQHEVFTEMSKRGWYQTEAAEDNKITQAKQKFASDASCC